MGKNVSIEDFDTKIDSLYRLVIVASRRASQVNRRETGLLVGTRLQKPTIVALQEILDDKVTYSTGPRDEEDLLE